MRKVPSLLQSKKGLVYFFFFKYFLFYFLQINITENYQDKQENKEGWYVH
jgi:hypothetical protein